MPGFQFKYGCYRLKDNRLGLTGGVDSSIHNYYNSDSTWAPKESYSAKSTIPKTNVPISCTTNGLGGREDQLYTIDVHIGLDPNSDHGKPMAPMPSQPLLPEPEGAVIPGVGDEIRLPNGDVSRVIDYYG